MEERETVFLVRERFCAELGGSELDGGLFRGLGGRPDMRGGGRSRPSVALRDS